MGGDDNRGNGLDCSVREPFEGFTDEWREHRREAREAMEKVRTIHSTIGTIQLDTKNLTHLEAISGTITDIKRHHFWSMLALLGILGFVVLVVVMKESNLRVKTPWFEIGQEKGQEHER